jgi:hypothetical protein
LKSSRVFLRVFARSCVINGSSCPGESGWNLLERENAQKLVNQPGEADV